MSERFGEAVMLEHPSGRTIDIGRADSRLNRGYSGPMGFRHGIEQTAKLH